MHPVLIEFGRVAIQSYGVLLAAAFIFGIAFAVHRAEKKDVPQKFILDLSIIIIFSSLIGARFLYVIYHLDEFSRHWLDIISPFQSSGEFGIAGLTFLGGLVGAILVSWIYVRIKGYSFLFIADILAPSIALGLIFVRIGCYLNGCCYGLPAGNSWWGVVFPMCSPAGSANPGIPVYPTQLFSSIGGLVMTGILLLAEDKKHLAGFTFFLFLLLYGIHRILIDMFRYYEPSMVLVELNSFSISVNQGLSFLLILTGLTGIIRLRFRKKI